MSKINMRGSHHTQTKVGDPQRQGSATAALRVLCRPSNLIRLVPV